MKFFITGGTAECYDELKKAAEFCTVIIKEVSYAGCLGFLYCYTTFA